MPPNKPKRISSSRTALARSTRAPLLSNVITWFTSSASCTRVAGCAIVKPLCLVTIAFCDYNHRVWRKGSAMNVAMAERIPVLAGGAIVHSNMSKICRKLVRLHVSTRRPVRRLVRGVGSEGHRATPSIWRGSRLRWFELAVTGARTSARRGLDESTAEAVARNLIHTTAGHKGRSALLMLGVTNEPAAAA